MCVQSTWHCVYYVILYNCPKGQGGAKKMAKKFDYMVTTYQTQNEEIYDTLKEARARAKELSKKYTDAKINKWVLIDSDMVFCFVFNR